MSDPKNIQEYVVGKVIEYMEDYETQIKKFKQIIKDNRIYECQHCQKYVNDYRRCITCRNYGCIDCSETNGSLIFDSRGFCIYLQYKCNNCVSNKLELST